MTYNFNYHIISIDYFDVTRVTTVTIVNESTGEIFNGTARRNPRDEMDMGLATSLATERAVRKGITADLLDDETMIIDQAHCCDFNF